MAALRAADVRTERAQKQRGGDRGPEKVLRERDSHDKTPGQQEALEEEHSSAELAAASREHTSKQEARRNAVDFVESCTFQAALDLEPKTMALKDGWLPEQNSLIKRPFWALDYSDVHQNQLRSR